MPKVVKPLKHWNHLCIPKVCLQRAFKMLLRWVLRCVWHSSGCLMLNSCNQAWPPRSPRHRDAGIGRGRPQDHLAKLGSWVDGKGSRVPHPQLKPTLDQDKSSNKPSHWPTPINGVGKRFRENLQDILVYSFHTVWRWLGASKCQSGNAPEMHRSHSSTVCSWPCRHHGPLPAGDDQIQGWEGC